MGLSANLDAVVKRNISGPRHPACPLYWKFNAFFILRLIKGNKPGPIPLRYDFLKYILKQMLKLFSFIMHIHVSSCMYVTGPKLLDQFWLVSQEWILYIHNDFDL